MWKRLSVLWSVIRGDARMLWLALRHPQAPGWLKWGVGGLVLYVLSPVDFIPDVIPLLGVVDDVVLLPLAILRKSKANNPALGVTGVLCFSEGIFLQVLEGGRSAVNQLYNRLSLIHISEPTRPY